MLVDSFDAAVDEYLSGGSFSGRDEASRAYFDDLLERIDALAKRLVAP